MYWTLRDFVDGLEAQGELVRVRERVSPILEIAEIADRVSKSRCARDPGEEAKRTDPRFWDRGGSAILFEDVEGSEMPVLINGWGSYRRMAMALRCQGDQLGVDDGIEGGFEAIAARIGELVKPEPPRSLGEVIEKARAFWPLLRIKPRRVKRGVCQEVVWKGEGVDLSMLPVIRCWPDDGDFAKLGYPAGVNDGIGGVESGEWSGRGRYITLASIHTVHPDDVGKKSPKSHNIGMYRVQVLGKRTLAMHWHMHHDGAGHWRAWKARGEAMPVAVALGGEAVLPYAATAPLPPGISELLLAGYLNSVAGGGGGVRLTRGVTVPIWVPANAEIVIEGRVSAEAGFPGWDPREEGAGALGDGAVFEGPFGDHTGFYSLPDRYPRLDVTAITHRTKPIYPTTIVGLPPQEDYYLGKATERIFLPLLKTLIHDIEDYDLPMFGAFHNCAVIRIRKAYPLQARRVMHAVWGAGQMAWTKCVIVVDESVDCHDLGAVMGAMAAHCDPARDIETVNGPLDILDHAAPRLAAGTKIGFDCTPKVAGEEVNGVAVGREVDGVAVMEGAALEGYLEAVRGIEGVEDAASPGLVGGAWVFVRTAKPTVAMGGGALPAEMEGLGRRVVEAVLGGVGEGVGVKAPPMVAAFSRDVDVHDADAALFHWAASVDPGRDMIRGGGGGEEAGRVGFDATAKAAGEGANGQGVRAWPPILEMDAATKRLVDEKWERYGIE